MAAPYTSVSVTSYNSNPPADDGSQVAANRVTWATEKTKLTDPLKTAIEAINTGIGTAFGKVIGGGGITSTAISLAVGSSDQGKLVVATAAGITITTPDAAVVTSPFVFGVLNNSSGDITLDGSGSQTVNGSLTLTMKAGDGWLVFVDGSNWFVIGRKTGILPRGYIDGCILANGTDATNDINIAAGVCRDSTNSVDITVAAMAGKQLDANWAAGAGAGMRNSAAGIANATYHIWAVAKADGTQDIYAHTSAVAATVLTALQAESGGSNYLYLRMIGSIVRASAAIDGFTQVGDVFRRTAPGIVISGSYGTSSTTETLAGVPTGISVHARLNMWVSHGSGSLVHVRPTTETDAAVSSTTAPLGSAGDLGATSQASQLSVWTDTSGQVAIRALSATTLVRAALLEWVHPRGKDA